MSVGSFKTFTKQAVILTSNVLTKEVEIGELTTKVLPDQGQRCDALTPIVFLGVSAGTYSCGARLSSCLQQVC